MHSEAAVSDPGIGRPYAVSPAPPNNLSFQRTLFEGSPAYKKRRMRPREGTSPSVIDEHGIRRGSPAGRSLTAEMRSGTHSPRASHAALRKVSGESSDQTSERRNTDNAFQVTAIENLAPLSNENVTSRWDQISRFVLERKCLYALLNLVVDRSSDWNISDATSGHIRKKNHSHAVNVLGPSLDRITSPSICAHMIEMN